MKRRDAYDKKIDEIEQIWEERLISGGATTLELEMYPDTIKRIKEYRDLEKAEKARGQ